VFHLRLARLHQTFQIAILPSLQFLRRQIEHIVRPDHGPSLGQPLPKLQDQPPHMIEQALVNPVVVVFIHNGGHLGGPQ
jgi:hypothetical protein